MRLSFGVATVTLLGVVFLTLVMFAASMIESPIIGLIVPIAAGSLILMLIRPMWGLLPLVLLSQLDALANIMSEALPISIAKVLTFLVLGGVIINSYSEARDTRIGPREPALAFGVMFGIVLMASSLFAESFVFTMSALEKHGGALILYYLMIRLITKPIHVELVILAIVSSTLFSALVVLYDTVYGDSLFATSVAATSAEFEGGARSAGASDRDPTTAATMLLAGTLLAMFLAVHTRRWLWLNLPTAIIGSGAVAMSLARSSSIAYYFAIAWLIWKFRRHIHFPGVIAAAVMVGVMALPFVPADYWDRMASLGDIESDRSLQRRIAYNMIGLELLYQNPVLGVGPGNFQYHYVDEPFRHYPARTLKLRRLHNMFLSVAVETGLVGFVCFMGILLAVVIGLEDARTKAKTPKLRLEAEALQFSFFCYLIASMFNPNEYNKYTWILAGLGIAITRMADIEKPRLPLLFGRRRP